MSKNTGGPAFPFHVINNSGADALGAGGAFVADGVEAFGLGMTLRDYLAGQALSGWPVTDHGSDTDALARKCYAMADAMLRAREVQHD